MHLLKPRKGLIGIDITSAAVKLLEIKQRTDHYLIERYAMYPLGKGAVVERRIRDIQEVVNALSRVVELAKPSTRSAVVAVPASAAITRILSFPATLSESEIEECIYAESDRHIPFPFSEMAFDFQYLGPSPDDQSQQQVMLVACRHQNVSQLTEILACVGLKPAVVEVDTLALERSLAKLNVTSSVGHRSAIPCIGVVDIGAYMSAFHVVHEGNIVYSRDQVLGGQQLTNALCAHYSISIEEADFAKKHGGLPHDYPDKVLSPFLNNVAQYVKRALQLYYASRYPHAIQSIVLIGGSSVLEGLIERISEATGLPVGLVDPLQRVRIGKTQPLMSLKQEAPALLTLMGLAMRKG